MISGYVCVRNGDSLDYCWREAVESLLHVADEVVISDGESTDGTREAAEEWSAREPRLRVVTYPWPDPFRRVQWWVEWINAARLELAGDFQLHLDADEVIDPGAREAVRSIAARGKSAWFERLNYWADAEHLAPIGRQHCRRQMAACGVPHHHRPLLYALPERLEALTHLGNDVDDLGCRA